MQEMYLRDVFTEAGIELPETYSALLEKDDTKVSRFPNFIKALTRRSQTLNKALKDGLEISFEGFRKLGLDEQIGGEIDDLVSQLRDVEERWKPVSELVGGSFKDGLIGDLFEVFPDVTGARFADSVKDERAVRLLEEASKETGVEKPELIIVESDAPNGRGDALDPSVKRYYIAISTADLELFDDKELKALYGHELGEVQYRREQLKEFTIEGFVNDFKATTGRLKELLALKEDAEKEEKDTTEISKEALKVNEVFQKKYYLLLEDAFEREFKADGMAAKTEGGIASAKTMLEKLHAGNERFGEVYANTNIVCYNAIQQSKLLNSTVKAIKSPKAVDVTHPPLDERLAALERLAGGGPGEARET